MNKGGDELSVCYWCFDELAEARQFFEQLKRGCTAYNVRITFANNLQILEEWAIGDEFSSTRRLLPR